MIELAQDSEGLDQVKSAQIGFLVLSRLLMAQNKRALKLVNKKNGERALYSDAGGQQFARRIFDR